MVDLSKVKRASQPESEFSGLWKRMDEDADLYHMKQYQMTDKIGALVPGVVNVTLKGVPNETTGSLFPLGDFEHIVNERVVNPFDHKHLNLDVPEFADLNPSVENITRVIFNRLKDAFPPATLAAVRVYETPKTYAEYRGD